MSNSVFKLPPETLVEVLLYLNYRELSRFCRTAKSYQDIKLQNICNYVWRKRLAQDYGVDATEDQAYRKYKEIYIWENIQNFLQKEIDQSIVEDADDPQILYNDIVQLNDNIQDILDMVDWNNTYESAKIIYENLSEFNAKYNIKDIGILLKDEIIDHLDGFYLEFLSPLAQRIYLVLTRIDKNLSFEDAVLNYLPIDKNNIYNSLSDIYDDTQLFMEVFNTIQS